MNELEYILLTWLFSGQSVDQYSLTTISGSQSRTGILKKILPELDLSELEIGFNECLDISPKIVSAFFRTNNTVSEWARQLKILNQVSGERFTKILLKKTQIQLWYMREHKSFEKELKVRILMKAKSIWRI